MIKLIIFDFDGVIISGSNDVYLSCYHKALESVGIVLDPKEEKERIMEKWGKGYKIQLEYLLKEHPYLIKSAINSYKKCYDSLFFTDNIKIIEGALDSLKKLSKKYKLAIASGMKRKSLEHYLAKFNLTDYFEHVISSEDIKNPEDKKPAPFMLNFLLKKFGIDKKCAVYVGDGTSDIKMARTAEIEPIIVLTGHLSKKEAKELGVEKIIPDINYLEKVLIEI